MRVSSPQPSVALNDEWSRASGNPTRVASSALRRHSPSEYGLDTWTTTEGLPQNLLHSVRQSRDGYLRLTSYAGFVRFDGVRFTVFDKSNTPGIATNRLGALFESADGTLWGGHRERRPDPSSPRHVRDLYDERRTPASVRPWHHRRR